MFMGITGSAAALARCMYDGTPSGGSPTSAPSSENRSGPSERSPRTPRRMTNGCGCVRSSSGAPAQVAQPAMSRWYPHSPCTSGSSVSIASAVTEPFGDIRPSPACTQPHTAVSSLPRRLLWRV
jgi:hypothetical protein